MPKPVVAIVGRPNVGKSTLFNKLIGERRSIVEDTPGVTRDRIYGECEWRGVNMAVIDTGGIEPETENEMFLLMRSQAQLAIDAADVILFVCDIRAGLTADDRDIAIMLKKSGKPVIPCVNKADSAGEPPAQFYEFYELGFECDPISLSALHGSGTGDLLDLILERLPGTVADEDESDRIKVAVIGRPNAGKSSLVNRILGEERLIVSEVAGTTRDAIDTAVENESGAYTFIDTAGMRRQSKIYNKIEKYSVLRAKMAVERADVCLIMLDATAGLTEQDERVAGIAHEAGRASVFVVNKWDLVGKSNETTGEFTKQIREAFAFMQYAPVIFVSAKTGQRVVKLFELINSVYEQNRRRITTGLLNDLLGDATARVQPPSDKGKRLKIYYMTQASAAPPTFVIFCNSEELFHYSYQRYIENCLREAFGFEGTPIRLVIRRREEK